MILFNVNNTYKKTISQVLCQILGIGKKISLYICKQCSVLPTTPFNHLTESQKTFIIKWIDEVLIHNISFGPYYKRQLKERISFFKKLKNFRFQGLLMELTLVDVNVLLVLSLIYAWNNFFGSQEANNDKEFDYKYVRVGEDSQGSK